MRLVIGFDFGEDAFRRKRLMGRTERGALNRTQLKQVLL